MTDENKTTEDLVQEADEQARAARGERADDGRPAAEQADQPADAIEPADEAGPVDEARYAEPEPAPDQNR